MRHAIDYLSGLIDNEDGLCGDDLFSRDLTVVKLL